MDLVIAGGVVVDGTGASRQPADVGIEDGRIVTIAPPGSIRATKTIDADGMVVSPGFVDLHTHYDAQVFWDPACTPSPLHGVTTVIGGNCGFSIAPLEERDHEYMMTMLALVEGMAVESLHAGVPWDWRTMGDYLCGLDGTLSVNAGFLAGHTAIRRAVMGERSVGEEASEADLPAMRRLLADCLGAGALGFSSSWAESHHDAGGQPVPSRHANAGELISLCEVVGQFPGTTLEFIPTVRRFEQRHYDVMTRMSLAADRPVNWNLLVVSKGNESQVEERLAASSHAAERGARVVALTVPDTMRVRLTITSGVGFTAIPGWGPTLSLPHAEMKAALADPAVRAQLAEGAKAVSGPMAPLVNWDTMMITEAFSHGTKPFEGRTVGDVAAELARPPIDTFLDIVIADDLRTVLSPGVATDDDETWRRRVDAWRDPRAILGGSDAGAHLDSLDAFIYTTALLGPAVREKGLLELEEAVHRITDVPARLYGLTGRGRVAEGWWADLVIFDPERIGPGRVHTRNDLPAGAQRLYADASGIEHVLVNGQEIVRGTELTGATPGVVLRSGRDTELVTNKS